jgi:hypothetical protein
MPKLLDDATKIMEDIIENIKNMNLSCKRVEKLKNVEITPLVNIKRSENLNNHDVELLFDIKVLELDPIDKDIIKSLIKDKTT